ncbi:MAG: C40 family peptidase [Tissierellia bacterium]|nr:C40 family peptidase [Tissierellia bacterium]
MSIKKHSIPLGLAAVCVIGLVGYKDTGIFVNKYTAKADNGVQISYDRNSRANIVEENRDSFKVVDNNNTFYVPKSHLLKVDNGASSHVVSRNTSITDPSTGEVIRILFLDEQLEHIADAGNKAKVRTDDNIVGLVNKSDLDSAVERNITYGVSKVDKTLNNGNASYRIKYGQPVRIAWFEKDYYIIYDDNNNKFNLNVEDVSLVELDTTETIVKQEVVGETLGDSGYAATLLQEDVVATRAKTEKVEKVEKAEKAIVIEEEKVEPKKEYVKPSNPNYGVAEKAISLARENMGSKYVFGDVGKEGFDCSGLVYAAYVNELGIKLPRSSKDQATAGVEVDRDDLEVGDLLFFDTTGNGGVSHVGIYTGNNMMLHASSSRGMVVEDSLDTEYYNTRFLTARRVIF